MQLNNEPGSKINVRLPLNNKILKYTNNNIINYKIIFYEKLDRIFGCYIEFSSESKFKFGRNSSRFEYICAICDAFNLSSPCF